MKTLVTGDWQADFENLDTCARAAAEVIRLCRKNEVDTVVLAGDLKRAYNPVDIRVTRFWMDTIYQFVKEEKLDVVAVLGNHDRVGMYADASNWLPILARAGAKVYDKPGRWRNLFILPYATSNDSLRKSAAWLSHEAEGTENPVLIFHGDVRGALYSLVSPRKSETGLSISDLRPDAYRVVVGGHIHLQQRLGKNVYYVGSPFCTDWGEANQKKGYFLIADGQLRPVPSQIPGWYDPKVRGFFPPKSWKGTRVRIHVECEGASYMSALQHARAAAEKEYEGAQITVMLRSGDSLEREVDLRLDETDPDRVKVAEYVGKFLPGVLQPRRKAMISYLAHKLQRVGGAERVGEEVKFLEAEGRNFLSFEKIHLDFRKYSGLVTVTGRNRDWVARSNGSGKTNSMSLIPVTLFGQTFKGQKHDRWARYGTKEKAWGKVKFKDARGRVVEVLRGRRPSRLQIWVDGVDQSSGMNQGKAGSTQEEVEVLTGLTWQTLSNAVYIDSRVAGDFLFGTQKMRSELLARFQNLERFDVALAWVRAEDKLWVRLAADAAGEAEQAEAQLAEVQRARQGAAEVRKVNLEKLQSRRAKIEKKWVKLVRRLKDARFEEELRTDEEKLQRSISREFKVRGKLREAQRQQRQYDRWMHDAKKSKVCSVCHRPYVGKEWDAVMQEVTQGQETAEKLLRKYTWQLEKSYQKRAPLTKRIEDLQKKKEDLEILVAERRTQLREIDQQIKEGKQVGKDELDLQRRGKELEEARRTWRRARKAVESESAFMAFAIEALSRNGLPAYLNGLLVPRLNRVARELSQELTDGQIQVGFRLEEGELIPEVINGNGGETILDQSDGERALAGLITSFALREIAPRCNLLILDEPGTGLDTANVRTLASALRKLVGKGLTIFVISHDANLAQELGGDHSLKIEKNRGISQIAVE